MVKEPISSIFFLPTLIDASIQYLTLMLLLMGYILTIVLIWGGDSVTIVIFGHRIVPSLDRNTKNIYILSLHYVQEVLRFILCNTLISDMG